MFLPQTPALHLRSESAILSSWSSVRPPVRAAQERSRFPLRKDLPKC
jgi:hypothetical protein